ncbi:glutamyl-tRNA reductase [Pavlovales sp. CCMP2436]|nr:glutamyl-tRNA reductase [Pavlovales sp. CCMP2436]
MAAVLTGAVAPPAAVAAEVTIVKPKKKASGGVPGQPLVIGLSHHTASVDVREKLAVKEPEWNNASRLLLERCPSVQEAAVLSTCNRFELHLVTPDRNAAIRDVMEFLVERSGLPEQALWDNLFMLGGEDAAWHLLRVSAGLDSLVVGEGQILSQVKACFTHATEPDGSAGKVLGRLLNVAVAAGKRVRSETSISKGAVSISSAAAELADMRSQVALGKPWADASICIVGAGTMSRLLLTHLASKGMTRVRLLNRGLDRSQELAAQYPDVEVSCEGMEMLDDALATCDAVFTSTGADYCIVTKPMLAELVPAGKKLMLIDISVPRNIETECNDVPGVSAYNVDDLKSVVAKNQASRRRSVLEAEHLLASELDGFMSWQRTLDYVPVIGKLQANAEAIRAAELLKAAGKLNGLDAKQMEAVERCTKSIINKILHSPMTYLRKDVGGQLSTREIVEGLFDLGP